VHSPKCAVSHRYISGVCDWQGIGRLSLWPSHKHRPPKHHSQVRPYRTRRSAEALRVRHAHHNLFFLTTAWEMKTVAATSAKQLEDIKGAAKSEKSTVLAGEEAAPAAEPAAAKVVGHVFFWPVLRVA
jgi:hypothetical protein